MTWLDKRIEAVQPISNPVGQQIVSICAQGGGACWIDWPNVGQVGLGPASKEVVVTFRRTIRQVLKDYVEQYSLVPVMLDERTLWLTSAQAYRVQSQLFVLANNGMTVEQVQEQLRQLTPVTETGIGKISAVATPDGKFILLRCCRATLVL